MIDNGASLAYNNNEERTTHTVSSSSNWFNVLWQSHKVNRHLAGVAVVFLAGFAFWEVSFTIIVIVHFLIWKVIRIRTTSLSEDGANRLRVCMNALHCPLLGTYFLQESRSFVKVFAVFLTPPDFACRAENFACPRGKMARLQIAVFPVNAVPIPVGAAISRPYGMTGVYLFSVYSLKEVKNDRPAHAFPSRGRWHSASPASRMTDEVALCDHAAQKAYADTASHNTALTA